MVPYSRELEDELKHELKQVGRKYVFSIRDLLPDDAGLYQMDVDGVTVFSTDFKSKCVTLRPTAMFSLPPRIVNLSCSKNHDCTVCFNGNITAYLQS